MGINLLPRLSARLIQALFLAIPLVFPPSSQAEETAPPKTNPMIIGSGSVSGLYFPAAGAICREVNLHVHTTAANNPHCAVEPTEGSVDNIHSLQNGTIQLGIAQSDVVANAWNGTSPFTTNLNQLRSVIALYSEVVTIVVRSDIKNINELQGRTISIGSKGSGSRGTANDILATCNLNPKLLDENQELTPEKAVSALRSKTIDAYFVVIGHPNENLWNALSTADTRILPLSSECQERLVTTHPYFVKTTIPAGLYPKITDNIPSIAVQATLVTTSDMNEDAIYQVTRGIVEKLYRFSRLDPDFKIPDPRSLFEGLVAPLHIGAFKYFQEMRLFEIKAGRPDPKELLKSVPVLEGEPTSHWQLDPAAPLHLASIEVGYVHQTDPIHGLVLSHPQAAITSAGGAIHWLVASERPLATNKMR
ncbi:MAG: TAXI family TRAP transporter solute-binding subunit [Magnetococcales bacterium]|nr:TAXI family TRAP transporter solute-binding subunit [Magnetococcales bacterium]